MKEQIESDLTYHTELELNKITNWDWRDVFGLVEHIRDMWNWKNDYFKTKWNKNTLLIELHTGGWGGNEEVVNALEKHRMFFSLYHTKWERGGHYYFEIDPRSIGYKPVQEVCKEFAMSRQAVVKNTKLFESIHYGKNLRNKLYRIKTNNN